MAYLREIIYQKQMLDDKIEELVKNLRYEQTEALASEILLLIDKRQDLFLKIQTANNNSTLKIGGSEVSIATALVIRTTITHKIDILTSLINNEDCNLNKVELQRQRDRHYEEYILLTMGIERNDLQVQVN